MVWFNRKKLYTDSSQQDAARVWGILKANGIPYDMDTRNIGTSFRRNLHSGMSMNIGLGGMGYAPFAEDRSFLYVIYVRRKDYDRARALISLA